MQLLDFNSRPWNNQSISRLLSLSICTDYRYTNQRMKQSFNEWKSEPKMNNNISSTVVHGNTEHWKNMSQHSVTGAWMNEMYKYTTESINHYDFKVTFPNRSYFHCTTIYTQNYSPSWNMQETYNYRTLNLILTNVRKRLMILIVNFILYKCVFLKPKIIMWSKFCKIQFSSST